MGFVNVQNCIPGSIMFICAYSWNYETESKKEKTEKKEGERKNEKMRILRDYIYYVNNLTFKFINLC